MKIAFESSTEKSPENFNSREEGYPGREKEQKQEYFYTGGLKLREDGEETRTKASLLKLYTATSILSLGQKKNNGETLYW